MPHLLVLNAGSSTLKFALFECSSTPERIVAGKLDGPGTDGAVARYRLGRSPVEESLDVSRPEELLAWLQGRTPAGELMGAAHRVVHAGPGRFEPVGLTHEAIAELRRYESWDPDHLPAALTLVEAVGEIWPGLPQVACLDTTFHRELPPAAAILPIPRRFLDQGIRRYGFHGLAYTSVQEQLTERHGQLPEKCVFAHLGSGCSMTAVLAGRSVDTTMAFTPNSGLPMSTRSGDLDVGLFEFLADAHGMSPRELRHLMSREAGLRGISGKSGDVRALLEEPGDPHAREALEVFCYAVKKQIGSYAAALGGLDLVAFSGGIGENAHQVRRDACSGLERLFGLELDERANRSNQAVISTSTSRVSVHVVRADEEVVMASRARAVFRSES